MTPLKMVRPESSPKILLRVGMKSPGLHTYPLWARWLIRFVYFVTGYQESAHDIGITDDEQQADEWCLGPNYFYKPLYFGVALPPEQCAPGPTVWPRSEANALYKNYSPDGVFLTRGEFNALKAKIQQVTNA